MSSMNITRNEWGAAPAKRVIPMSNDEVDAIFIHWNGLRITLLKGFLARAIQRFHLSREFLDVAYNFLFDRKGNGMVGRGYGVQDGATSPRWAGRSYSIFAGIGQGQKPSVKLLRAIKAQVEEIRGEVGRNIPAYPHSFAYPTSCCGPDLTPWVYNGMPIETDAKPSKKIKPTDLLQPVLPALGSATLSRDDWRNRLPWRKRRVNAMQRALGYLGYGLVGTGPWGPATDRALLQFAKDHKLVTQSYSGPVFVGKTTWRTLRRAVRAHAKTS